MRDEESWHRPVSAELRRHWEEVPEGLEIGPRDVCRVELALLLLTRIAPGQSADAAYVPLSGYPFAQTAGLAVAEEQRVALTAARHLLWTIRRRRTWRQLLDAYRRMPTRLRAFDVEAGGPPVSLRPTVAADRLAVYEAALEGLPPYRTHKLELAPAGPSSFLDRRRATSADIPEDLVFPRVGGHDLDKGRAGDGGPLVVTRAMLLETARWMDEQESGSEEPDDGGQWGKRLTDLHITVRDAAGWDFTERCDQGFTLDGLLHMVGMVGAGKSTLMTVLAVWAARLPKPLRTTLVVGDVAEQLRLTEVFERLGIQAAPVVGHSTRERHVQRLHRRQASKGLDNLLNHVDRSFDLLSTVCVVDALRDTEAVQPLRYSDAPCVGLRPAPKSEPVVVPDLYERTSEREGTFRTREEGRTLRGTSKGCPVWSRCPRHSTARALVDAQVWIANPASLVQSDVPRHLTDERLRYLELACVMSDIVVVDEADAVQLRMDGIFAPSATLVQPGPDSWLDRVHTHKIAELSRHSRLPLADREIERWNTSLAVVSAATDKLYQALISDGELRDWVDVNYFSPWTLQEKLLADWYEEPAADDPDSTVPDEHDLFEDDSRPEGEEVPDDGTASDPAGPAVDARRAQLTSAFDAFRDDPLGHRGPHGGSVDRLVDLTRDLLHTDSATETRKRARTLLDELVAGTPVAAQGVESSQADRMCRRLEFTLLLSALSHRLDRLAWLWPQVEAALRLDSTGNELSRRPPLDYAPIVPEAPMGNVLGFQYLRDDRETDEDGRQSGTLRFFRCAGVGRELLTSLSLLGSDPGRGRPGPHVLLMSGTSWAGMSTRSHLPVPVGAVLKPSPEATEAVLGTSFATRFLHDAEGKPIQLSGVDSRIRPLRARAMATRLGSRGRGGTASPLEQELATVADPQRRRAILLVGSYSEAATVAGVLNTIDRWHGRVRLLVADDADLDVGSGSAAPPSPQERVEALRRGDLATFAQDPEAEVLVAPLMAVERGHNILNAQRNAAFGLAMFLVRPHPVPDDLALAVYSVNDWAARFIRNQRRDDDREGPATFGELVTRAGGLDRAALDFRHEARQEWRRLLTRRYMVSRLPAWERRVFAWDQLVVLWQVIGRLVRGGVPARVVFVDAAFAPKTARAMRPGAVSPDLPLDEGLLRDLLAVLSPYFDESCPPGSFADPADPAVARLLYRPLYEALKTIPNRV